MSKPFFGPNLDHQMIAALIKSVLKRLINCAVSAGMRSRKDGNLWRHIEFGLRTDDGFCVFFFWFGLELGSGQLSGHQSDNLSDFFREWLI